MPEWLELTNGWAAIPLAIVGFGVTIWQVVVAGGKAEAARLAVAKVSDQIRSNILLIVLPQLVQVEARLEWAVSREDREAVIHYLGEWRWQAGQVRGHLVRSGEATDEMLTALQSSIATSADAKITLQDKEADLKKRVKAAQRAIANVTGQAGELTARSSIEGGNNSDQQQAASAS